MNKNSSTTTLVLNFTNVLPPNLNLVNITNFVPSFKLNAKSVLVQNLPAFLVAIVTVAVALVSFAFMWCIYKNMLKVKEKEEEEWEEEKKKMLEDEEKKKEQREEKERQVEEERRMEEGIAGGGLEVGSSTNTTTTTNTTNNNRNNGGGNGGGNLLGGLFGIKGSNRKLMLEIEMLKQGLDEEKRRLEQEQKRIKKEKDEESRRVKIQTERMEEKRKMRKAAQEAAVEMVKAMFGMSATKMETVAMKHQIKISLS